MMNTPLDTVRRVPDPEAVARAAAGEVTAAASAAVRERGRFTVALAGGTTPRRLYRLLADPAEPWRGAVPWDRVHVFFGDERHVPAGHRDSNYRMAHEALLRHVAVASVHRIPGELPDAARAAAAYQADLERSFNLDARADPPPSLDLVLLGLGADGHTASLFPGSAALEELRAWVAAPFVERLGASRITLTLPVLARAGRVLFLVAGAAKARALERTLACQPGSTATPAARVRPGPGRLAWIVDRAAAALLPPPGHSPCTVSG
jgi:6-phosphogluconolactonase